MNWAWEQHTRSSGERVVLVVLAWCADAEGRTWVPTARVASMAGLHPTVVRRHRARLVERGLVRWLEDRQQWQLTLDR